VRVGDDRGGFVLRFWGPKVPPTFLCFGLLFLFFVLLGLSLYRTFPPVIIRSSFLFFYLIFSSHMGEEGTDGAWRGGLVIPFLQVSGTILCLHTSGLLMGANVNRE
jgi:hypothetical protein